MRTWSALIATLAISAGVARADIYEWTDASGARHFTNHRETVPAAERDSAQVLIADLPQSATAPAPAAPVAAAAPAPAPADPPTVDTAYLAGLVAGMRMEAGGGGGGAAAGGAVQIYGPLAVSASRSDDDGLYGGEFYGRYPGYYYPFVTTGFDGGRSRHQTLRMLLQDQFAIDREGPFAYDRWNQPGVGPALAPFLPRGLPLPIQQYGRVIYR
jgi:hypothetical protein